MDRNPLALALLTFSGLAACAAVDTPTVERAPAPVRPGYTLVLIKTGPRSGQLSKEENARAFAGHFANMGRMADARQLLVAGPYGEGRHDPELRGLFVLASARRDEARAWAETDPTTQAGVFVLEYHTLETPAPLVAALERDLAWRAQQVSAGKTPAPGEGARAYVLLTAEHGDLAERELGALETNAGGVLLLARLDGTRAFALLDAANLDEARERFGPQLEHLGAHELDEWFASEQLARLVE
ncbi:MAG: hypothetical protein HOP15_17675 [Planctomycetes bacterium]|nr:hypothetical protein [Planctomycetota bacterium]